VGFLERISSRIGRCAEGGRVANVQVNLALRTWDIEMLTEQYTNINFSGGSLRHPIFSQIISSEALDFFPRTIRST